MSHLQVFPKDQPGVYINKLKLGPVKADLSAKYKYSGNDRIDVNFIDIAAYLGSLRLLQKVTLVAQCAALSHISQLPSRASVACHMTEHYCPAAATVHLQTASMSGSSKHPSLQMSTCMLLCAGFWWPWWVLEFDIL